MNYKNIIILILAVALLVFGGLYIFSPKPVENLGIGEVTGEQWWAVTHAHEGMYFGTGRQASIDRSGAIVTSGGITNTGAFTGTTGTFSSTLGVTGAFTGTSGAFSTTLAVTGETQLSSLVQGGSVLSPTSTAPVVLTAAQACNNSIVNVTDWTGRASSTDTLTLPSVTTLYADCLNTQGDFLEFLFRNNASTAGSSTLIVAGTNIVLTESDNGADADVVIAGGNSAIIKLWRVLGTATSSGVYANVEEIRDAD